MKFCCYIPWKLYTNNTSGSFENFIDINSNLSILDKFAANYAIYKFQNKINLIVINQDDFKRNKILPIIEDMSYNQCFVAISIQWLEYPNNYSYNSPQDELVTMLEQLYIDNSNKINKCANKFLYKLCNYQFEEYHIL